MSEAVRRLEAGLGVRLLNRTTRSVTPTEAGERLLQRLGPALGEVASALDAVAEDTDKAVGTLRLNVPIIVARGVLPRIVGPFLAAHPGIVLEVMAEDSFIDVLAAGFDAGIRYEERLERDMIAVPIGPRVQRYAAAAAPGLFAGAWPARASAGSACSTPASAIASASGVKVIWEFERAGEIVRIAPTGPLLASSIELERQAAIDGIGIIITFEDELVDAIGAGLLEPVLQDWWQSFSGPFLYYPSRTHMPPPLRAFVDFIKRPIP